MNDRLCRYGCILVPLLGVAACSRVPMTCLRTFGPAADPVTSLGWGFIVVCTLVILLIAGLLLAATLRARVPQGALQDIPIAQPGGGLRWIYIGTGVSTAVLLGLVVWTMFTLAAIAQAPTRPAFTIEIRAHQWWWEVRYIDEVSDRTFVTANELHIPVGTPVQLRLIGDDVIHSFWIPALAGKTDVIPGQTNLAWIEGSTLGSYRGQCTEYCGAQHAHMAEFVTVDTAADFNAWWSHQTSAASSPSADSTRRGELVFLAHCAACHTVRGTGAGGIVGPDLTHIMTRHTLGAGTVPNNPEHLSAWIMNAQAVKPGCRMPTIDLPRPDLDAVTAYVQTLR